MNGKAETSYNNLRTAIIASAKARAAEKVIEGREQERLARDEELQMAKIKMQVGLSMATLTQMTIIINY